MNASLQEDIELGEVEAEEVQQQEEVIEEQEQEEVEAKAEPEEKPKKDSAHIDFDVLPEEHRDKVKMRIDSDFRKLKESERKQQEYQQKLRDMEEKLAELQKPKEVAPPTADDWYQDAEQAQRKQNEWMESQKASYEWNTQKQQREQQLQAELQRQAADRLERYYQNVDRVKIDRQELNYAENVVAQSGITQEVANYLLEHQNGPQIVMHLAKNPIVAQELASLSPIQAGVKLNELAAVFKPVEPKRKTTAPEPDEPIGGAKVSKTKGPYDDLLEGSSID